MHAILVRSMNSCVLLICGLLLQVDALLIDGKCSLPFCCSPSNSRPNDDYISCTRNSSMLADQKECSRLKQKRGQESFIPQCFGGKGLREVNFSREHISIDHLQITNSISKWTLRGHHTLLPITNYYEKPSAEQRLELKGPLIPPHFCIKNITDAKVEVVTCPSSRFADSAQIKKCCPFGEKAKLPILSGYTFLMCESASTEVMGTWNLKLNGYHHSLQQLIRFPHQYVQHNSDYFSCQKHMQLVYDYETFEIDPESGNLIFTRLLKRQEVIQGNYCVDLVTVKSKKKEANLMFAFFCVPRASIAHVKVKRVLDLTLPKSFGTKASGNVFISLLLISLTFVLLPK